MLQIAFVSTVLLGLVAAVPVAEASPRVRPTVIEDIRVKPVDSGTNPDAFAYRIHAKLLLGANACEARGVHVKLVTREANGLLEVVPIKTAPREGSRACAQTFRPLYREVDLVARGLSSHAADVVVRNIDHLGTRTSLSDLIPSRRTLTMTGTLSRMQALGGETTGYSLELASGEIVEIDLLTGGLDSRFKNLEGTRVTVKGRFKNIQGTEIPNREVFVVATLNKAP